MLFKNVKKVYDEKYKKPKIKSVDLLIAEAGGAYIYQ
jgi:hypothetical protein